MGFKKNTAVTGFAVGLVSATDGSDITTGTPVGYYTLDGGIQTAIADVTPTHEGNGLWTFDLTAAEMNGDIVGLTFTHASAITQHFTIKTETKLVSDLNDIAATAIVSGGAITTSAGAVSTVSTVSNAVTLPAIPANWITASGINASALNGKGDWNIGKTGYTLTQSFPANFADLAITVTTGKVTVGTNDDKAGYSISGTKTTLDSLNDIAATAIVSGGAITTSGGAVSTVTTLTGHTAQTGDSFARLGAPTGASVSADIAGIQSDTDNIQTRLPAALVGGRMDSNTSAINNSSTAATQLALSAAQIESGACEGTPTTTAIQTDLAETQDDIYIGRVVIFTSGSARGEATDITDYTGATGTITVTALSNAPAAGDTFILL